MVRWAHMPRLTYLSLQNLYHLANWLVLPDQQCTYSLTHKRNGASHLQCASSPSHLQDP
jgi:hypothetical protein